MAGCNKIIISLALAAATLLRVGPAIASTNAAAREVLPDRLLRCTLGRVSNFDPTKEQTLADLRYEGQHHFELFLPAVPVRTAPPPDATLPPEPVNPRTRIVADPDKLARGAPARFDSVVDYWPERVELTTRIVGPLVNLVVVHPIDAAHGTANLFMTQATDMTNLDLAHIYQGSCSVDSGQGAPVIGPIQMQRRPAWPPSSAGPALSEKRESLLAGH